MSVRDLQATPAIFLTGLVYYAATVTLQTETNLNTFTPLPKKLIHNQISTPSYPDHHFACLLSYDATHPAYKYSLLGYNDLINNPHSAEAVTIFLHFFIELFTSYHQILNCAAQLPLQQLRGWS